MIFQFFAKSTSPVVFLSSLWQGLINSYSSCNIVVKLLEASSDTTSMPLVLLITKIFSSSNTFSIEGLEKRYSSAIKTAISSFS